MVEQRPCLRLRLGPAWSVTTIRVRVRCMHESGRQLQALCHAHTSSSYSLSQLRAYLMKWRSKNRGGRASIV